MNSKILKRTIAAVMALTIVSGTLPVNSGGRLFHARSLSAEAADAGTVTLDEASGVLTLSGAVTTEQVKAYSDNSNVKSVVAAPGTVLPADCSFMFNKFRAESIDLRCADTKSVTKMESMFQDCKELVSIELKGFDTSNVETMYGMFQRCESLITLDLSSFNTVSNTSIQFMFTDCTSLKTILVSELWSNDKIKSSSFAFFGCKELIGGNGTAYYFLNTDKEYACIDKEGQPGYFTEKTCYSYDSTSKTLTLRNDIDKTRLRNFINDNADVKKITTESGTVFPADSSYLFEELYELEEVDLNGADTSAVTNMTGLFYGCTALKSITFGDTFDTSNVTAVNAMFRNCSSLTRLDLTAFDTGNVKKASNMFNGCTKLKKIIVSDGWDVSGATESSSMFKNCTSLVGGSGTVYNSANTNKTMARIDTVDNPGYLSQTSCVFDQETGVLTLRGFIDKDEVMSYGEKLVVSVVCEHGAVLPADCEDLFDAYDERGLDYFKWRSLTSVDLSNADASNVTTMRYMFLRCDKLASVTFGSKFNTSNVTDMSYMFGSCSSLKSLDLNGLNTSNVKDMRAMISDCKELKSVDISSFDTKNVTIMSHMFYGDEKLVTITVGEKWNTANVTDSLLMFDRCSNLVGENGTKYSNNNPKDVTYACVDTANTPGYLTQKCAVLSEDGTLYLIGKIKADEVMAYAKNDNVKAVVAKKGAVLPTHCTCLFQNFKAKSIDLSEADSSGVVYMSYMFDGCTNLTSLNLSGFNTSSVIDLDGTFRNCSALTTLDLTDFANILNSYGVPAWEDTSEMFSGCSKLATIKVSGSWHNDMIAESRDMFKGCSKLKGGKGTAFSSKYTDCTYAQVDGSGGKGYFTTDNISFCRTTGTLSLFGNFTREQLDLYRDGNAITHIEALPGCVLPADCTYVFNSDDKYPPSWRNVKAIDLSKADASNVTNMKGMFFCSSAKSINLSGLNTSKVTDMSGMFYDCVYLEELDLTGWNTSKVTSMKYMFSYCYKLAALDISSFDTSNVTDMNSLFCWCYRLEEIKLGSKFKTNKVTDMSGMFERCEKLPEIGLSSFDTSNVKSMANMFSECYSMKSPDLSSFDTSKVTDMNNMFSDICFTSLDLTSFDTSNVTNMNAMFYGSKELKRIFVSDKWTTASLAFTNNNANDKIFTYDTELVGGKGTAYDESHIGYEYAHIDGGEADPGYLTRSCCTYNNKTKTLTLNGELNRDQIALYNDLGVTTIIAADGAVFPADSTDLFNGMSTVKTIDLSQADTSNITEASGMFMDCTSLESLNLCGFDVSKVDNLSAMFQNCGKLTYLDLSGLDTSNVKYMVSMFEGCSALRTITVDDKWSTASVLYSDNMFLSCTSLRGGNGTKYSSSNIGASRAVIDGKGGKAGYLTENGIHDISFSHNVALNNNLGIVYYIPADKLEGYSNVKLIIHKELFNADGSQRSLTNETVTSYVIEDSGYGNEYVFRYNNIAAKEMGSKVYATVQAEKNGIVYESAVDVYSIKTYAMSKLSKSSTKPKLKTLLVDMLNYGTAAQTYFNYNRANLANGDLVVSQLQLGTDLDTLEIKSDYAVTNLNNATAEFSGKNLNLGNSVALVYYMQFNDTVDKNKVTLKLTYKTVKGASITKTVPFKDFTKGDYAGEYRYDFAEIAAKDSMQPVKAVLYENGKQISNAMTYSIQTYAYNKLNNTNTKPALRSIIEHMMAYYNSAKNYFA